MQVVPMLQVADVAASSGWYQRTLGLTSGHGGDEFEMLYAGEPYASPLLLQLHRWEADEHGFLGSPDLPAGNENKLVKILCVQEFIVSGKTTFKEEFVTAGGISLSEVDPNTMRSKIVPNLFFAGEVLNIDGVTGGFNFQNAWTTGYIAAKAISLGV